MVHEWKWSRIYLDCSTIITRKNIHGLRLVCVRWRSRALLSHYLLNDLSECIDQRIHIHAHTNSCTQIFIRILLKRVASTLSLHVEPDNRSHYVRWIEGINVLQVRDNRMTRVMVNIAETWALIYIYPPPRLFVIRNTGWTERKKNQCEYFENASLFACIRLYVHGM
jgi:hypothetical protein